MLNEKRTMYGDSCVIHAVPALAMTNGTFACVFTGAMAIADGEYTTPRIRLTLSRVMSSVAAVLAFAPDGGPSSRLMSSTLCGRISLACSFMYRSNALSCTSPRSALAPEYGMRIPILIVSAFAGAVKAMPSATQPNHFTVRIVSPLRFSGFSAIGPFVDPPGGNYISHLCRANSEILPTHLFRRDRHALKPAAVFASGLSRIPYSRSLWKGNCRTCVLQRSTARRARFSVSFRTITFVHFRSAAHRYVICAMS